MRVAEGGVEGPPAAQQAEGEQPEARACVSPLDLEGRGQGLVTADEAWRPEAGEGPPRARDSPLRADGSEEPRSRAAAAQV